MGLSNREQVLTSSLPPPFHTGLLEVMNFEELLSSMQAAMEYLVGNGCELLSSPLLKIEKQQVSSRGLQKAIRASLPKSLVFDPLF